MFQGTKSNRPVLRGLVAAGISWLLLVGAITLGMVVPRTEVLNGFGAASRLDYSAYASDFSPLSLAFITDILGLEEPLSADAPGPDQESGAVSGAVAGSAGADPSGSLTSAAPTEVEHPFTNDDIERAYTVKSLPFRGRTDTSDGTRSSDEPADCFPTGGTAWYRYRPSTDVALFSDTFGTPRATALGIYSRTAGGGLELIGCDKNALGNAQVGFPAEAGTAYYFQVTSMVRGGPTIFELGAVGGTTVETLTPSGEPPDGSAFDRPEISADGRFVVFTSFARNLTPTPPECPSQLVCASVYLRDRVTKRSTLISSMPVPSSPLTADSIAGIPFLPSISSEGRYVGFSLWEAEQGGLQPDPGPPNDQRPYYHTYLYDRVTKRVTLESRNSRGEPARRDRTRDGGWYLGGSIGPSMSTGGRYIVFTSDADNMPRRVRPNRLNVYRRDRVTGKTRLVSTNEIGKPNHSYNCAVSGRNISGDGRYVVY